MHTYLCDFRLSLSRTALGYAKAVAQLTDGRIAFGCGEPHRQGCIMQGDPKGSPLPTYKYIVLKPVNEIRFFIKIER